MLIAIKEFSDITTQLNISRWSFDGLDKCFSDRSGERCAYNESELVEYLSYPRINRYYEH